MMAGASHSAGAFRAEEYATLAGIVLGVTIIGVALTDAPLEIIIVGVGGLGHGMCAAKSVKEGLTL